MSINIFEEKNLPRYFDFEGLPIKVLVENGIVVCRNKYGLPFSLPVAIFEGVEITKETYDNMIKK